MIGTGMNGYAIEPSYLQELRSLGIKVDICPTFEAISTHNFCVESGINICTFLLPVR